ncbi:hypothetical protein [Methanosphaera cuniculi]|uniref:hypothetical protein n=1 Tax=Methanosphaera cuniculi TaxID=1077256 RepID=UPI0026F13901|nr:hypothetical protein [Methanosphaera cuniculi]
MSKDETKLNLRLSAIDCETSTKYYQLTSEISDEQKKLVKPYFKYYTPEEFGNSENVAGIMEGWMCNDEDINYVRKILKIKEERKKTVQHLQPVQKSLSKNITLQDQISEVDL